MLKWRSMMNSGLKAIEICGIIVGTEKHTERRAEREENK